MLSLLDTRPCRFSYADIDLLRDLADWVQKELASDGELERAFQVQRTLLPKAAPIVAGYEIAGRCVPARDVTGDFSTTSSWATRCRWSIADVMGKGVAAAIIAASVRAVLRGATRFIGLAEAVNRVATDLAPTSPTPPRSSRCSAPACTRRDLRRRRARAQRDHQCGRAHPPAALRRPPPLGVLDSSTCREQVTTLHIGETFVAVSDRLLDYVNTPGAAGTAVARSAMAATSAADLIDRISNYVMGHLVMDDLTAIVVRRTG